MAKKGDCYTVKLTTGYLNWGTHRYTGSRDLIPGEAYIPIPRVNARQFNIVNSNATQNRDELGKNVFEFVVEDNFMSGHLKAQGNNKAGDIYAKQFSVLNDLKALGSWFDHIGASEGTEIKVEWLTPTQILLSKADKTESH